MRIHTHIHGFGDSAGHSVPALDEALAFYGLGDGGPQETVQIAAVIDQWTDTSVVCDMMAVTQKGEPVKRCEFQRSEVTVEYYNASSALVSIPKSYLPVFGLQHYVLTGRVLDRFRELVKRHNAPYLPAAKPSESAM